MGYFDDFGFQSASLEPWIVQPPASFAVAAGQPAKMTIVAACSSYQWKKNGSVIGGATGSSYTIAAAGPGDAASYTCVMTGAGGSQESTPGVLNVIGGVYAAGRGIIGQYYYDTSLATLAANQLDPIVNFDGGTGYVFPGELVQVGPANFGIRWSGVIQPGFSETYTFYTTSDDGVRLWVNGNLLIDHWVGQSPKEWSGSIALNAGQFYPIMFEYYQGTGGAMVNLKWSSAHTPKDLIPASALYPEPVLLANLYGGDVVLSYSPAYTLMSAAEAAGPYSDVWVVPAVTYGALMTYTNAITAGPRAFFRLRSTY